MDKILPVYITRTGGFLPNDPVPNETMEEFLGLIHDTPSKSKRIVLRNNGIKNRYYAIKKDGTPTHTNAQMSALAVRKLFNQDAELLKNLDLLCCGTSTPDQMMPSHAVMVHGWLPEAGGIEVVSPSGVCCSGMHALKYAWMAVRTGEVRNAASTGSERLSRILRAEVFNEEASKLVAAEENPYITFDKEFLRWMLSDGAGAVYLDTKPNDDGISLRIDWLEGVSYAHMIDSCMYMGCDKLEDGSLRSYMDYSAQDLIDHSVLSIKQDVKLLGEHIVSFGFDKLKSLLDKHNFKTSEIDHFLPHLSSEFFRGKIASTLDSHGIGIPNEKWFTNLATVGNVGAGSIYLMIDELFRSGKLKKEEKVFLLVPESSRFSYMFALLTVV